MSTPMCETGASPSGRDSVSRFSLPSPVNANYNEDHLKNSWHPVVRLHPQHTAEPFSIPFIPTVLSIQLVRHYSTYQ